MIACKMMIKLTVAKNLCHSYVMKINFYVHPFILMHMIVKMNF